MLPCAIDSGDTAWILSATSLVLFMTPGVAFFYGGLARSKNMVNVIGMTLIVMGLISVQWVLWGYTLAFGPNTSDANKFMGALDYVGFNKVSHYAPLGALGACTDQVYYTLRSPYVVSEEVKCSTSWPGTIPHQLFVMFHKRAAIKQQRQPRPGVNAEMMPALPADILRLLQVLLPDNLPAAIALQPEAFGAYRALPFFGRFR